MKKRFKFYFTLCYLIVAYCQVAFCSASGVATEAIGKGMDFVALIPTAMGIFNIINAVIAFSQAQSEGGNAQASAKMSNCMVSAAVCLGLAVSIPMIFKPMILNAISVS